MIRGVLFALGAIAAAWAIVTGIVWVFVQLTDDEEGL